jgi:DNA-binding transcriptional ArsR family regulator
MVPAVDEPVSADVLQALSHPLRLAALVVLEAQPQTATEVAAALDVSPAALIHHLGTLRDLGLIVERGNGGRLFPVTQGWTEIAARLRDLQDS